MPVIALASQTSFVNSGIGQFVIYAGSTLTAAVVLATGGYVVKFIREFKGDFAEVRSDVKVTKEAQVETKRWREEVTPKIDEMYVAMAGEPATPLNPNPAPGLVAQMRDLTHESKPNDGGSQRDEIQRIAKAVGAERKPPRRRAKRPHP